MNCTQCGQALPIPKPKYHVGQLVALREWDRRIDPGVFGLKKDTGFFRKIKSIHILESRNSGLSYYAYDCGLYDGRLKAEGWLRAVKVEEIL